jgi:hypothetical protein
MTLPAQVDCAAVEPLVGAQWPLPRTGWLLFFQDEEFAAEPESGRGDDGCHVVHVPAGTPARRAPDRSGVPALPLVATGAASLPEVWTPGTAELFRADPLAALAVRAELTEVLEPAPRHRLLGWAEDEFFDLPGHRPLLQLAAEEGTAWRECVAVSFWPPEADLRAGRLESARRVCEIG